VDGTLKPRGGHSSLPRFGLKLALRKGFRDVGWLGRGPQESYWDRHEGARHGWWQSSILNQTVPYVRPQENGNKEDVTVACLTPRRTTPSASAVLLVGRRPFGLETHHFPDEAFGAGHLSKRASHTSDLTPAPYTWLHVDYRQQGVGGIDSWGWHPAPLPEYTVPAVEMRLQFALAQLAPLGSANMQARAIAAAKELQPMLEGSS